MPTAAEIRHEITAQIIAALEHGVTPWRRPWKNNGYDGPHANVVSHRRYSGINPLILELHSLRYRFSSRHWASFHQWADLGCRIKVSFRQPCAAQETYRAARPGAEPADGVRGRHGRRLGRRHQAMRRSLPGRAVVPQRQLIAVGGLTG